jgi:hypothetical protein
MYSHIKTRMAHLNPYASRRRTLVWMYCYIVFVWSLWPRTHHQLLMVAPSLSPTAHGGMPAAVVANMSGCSC